jgi:wobble nucleotide-excising tRNase
MLTSIKKVKGLGVFRDFTAAADLPAFGRFNLIYGENGSGKTTLSRLFRAIEDGDHAEYPDLAFTVATDAGDLTKGQKCARKIRVFNSDYIEANIGQFDNPIKHILIVGEDNKALAEEIKLEQAAFDGRSAREKVLTASLEKLEKDKGKIFTTIAATIGEATSGATQRRYRKPDAEAAFALVKAFKILTCAAAWKKDPLSGVIGA